MRHISILIILFFLLLHCSSATPVEPELPNNPDQTEEPDKPDEPSEPNNPTDPNDSEKWAIAKEINGRLGRGINLGNTFEAEQSWQSPFVADDLKRIADLGFTHIRVPIRWERDDRSMATAPYTIYPEFMATIQSVVNEALKQKLHVIINMHHHNDLFANPSAQKARFLSQWEQIADRFKSYPDSLLFEILNEPHDQLTPSLWNTYLSEALQRIRATNPNRCVLIGTADWGGVSGLQSLQLPNDPPLILTLHYYNPFQFTHQGASWSEGSDAWLGTKWQDTEFERQDVEDDFKAAVKFVNEKNIPLHVGEFGAYSRADMDSRVKWTRFLARWFEQQQFSWAYWEWNSGFGIYDPQTGQYHQQLVNALTKDPMPAAFQPSYVSLYSSNFSNGQAGGWFITNNNASAASTLQIANNNATITISKPGSVDWHIQFIKADIAIVKGKTYRLSFTASSPDNDVRSISVGVSRNSDPWTTYGNKTLLIDKSEASYNLVFTSAYTDAQARIVFSVGNAGNGRIVLSEIKLSEVIF